MLTNGKCERCNIGYVVGVPIKSRLLYEGLDAHGHTLMLETIECPTCKKAIEEDGFCDKCRIGWWKKQAYFSRLTYHTAKGVVHDPATITCPTCRGNTAKYGWCETCRLGMVGNVALSNRYDYEQAARGYDLMLAAIEASKRCDTCSLVILTDGDCLLCKKSYKDGKALPLRGHP